MVRGGPLGRLYHLMRAFALFRRVSNPASRNKTTAGYSVDESAARRVESDFYEALANENARQ